eukprot:1908813-Pleurochrysis_carterae.AAC.1
MDVDKTPLMQRTLAATLLTSANPQPRPFESWLEQPTECTPHYQTFSPTFGRYLFCFVSQDYSKALRLFLQCGERAVNQAIEVVGRARNDMLTHTLIDFLMGETDGVPKDPNFIFKLYMALGNYPQARSETTRGRGGCGGVRRVDQESSEGEQG